MNVGTIANTMNHMADILNSTGAPEKRHKLTVGQTSYQVIEGIFLFISGYLFVSLAFCLVKPCAEKVIRDTTQQFNSSGRSVGESNSASYDENPANNGSVGKEHRRIRQRAHLTMMLLTLAMSMTVVIRDIIDLWAYLERNSTSERVHCVRHIVSGLLYLLSAFCLYVFLWIRQRSFYAHPVLKHLARPGLVRFSWSVLGTIIIVMLSATILFFLPQFAPPTNIEDRTNISRNNSIIQDGLDHPIDYAENGVVPIECGFQRKSVYLGVHFAITLAFLYFQISLQFLFAFPIFKQRRRLKRSRDRRKFSVKLSKRSSTNQTGPAVKIKKCNSSSPNISNGTRGSSLTVETSNTQCKETSQDEIPESSNAISVQYFHSTLNEERRLFSSTPNIPQSTDEISLLQVQTSCPRTSSRRYDTITKTASFRFHADDTRNIHRQPNQMFGENPEAASSDEKRAAFRKISKAITSLNFKDIKSLPKNCSNAIMRKRTIRRSMRLQKYVLRCLCVSIICSVSDITVFVFIYFAQFHISSSFYRNASGVSESMLMSLAYNANMILNLLCMIACYRDWRVKICPWYYLTKRKAGACDR